MIGLPSGARVWLAVGRTDMRKGFDGLAAAVQERMAQDPFCGHLFVFRGRRGDLLKVLWWDGRATSAGAAQETTRVGSFLRDTRIDTLPQLIKVLRGDMSISDMSLFD
jgi:lipopolysaccharide/colanic/teichoic acid biosynthesis glycosyltransferase